MEESGGRYGVPPRRFAVGLGCEVAHAHRLVYARGMDLEDPATDVPIGLNCRLCERENCPQRAFPPMGRPLTVDENRRPVAPYPFTDAP